VLDVKVKDYPTHAANKPVAVIPNCAATRHVHFTLDGSGPGRVRSAGSLRVARHRRELGDDVRRVDLDTLTPEEVRTWKPGDTPAAERQAAHRPRRRPQEAGGPDRRGEPLPVDLTNRVIYYVGPVDPVRDEVVGPAGPTTATRMDKFTRAMLEQTGLIGMVGKAERGPPPSRPSATTRPST
jgi:fumarate hydratase, class I